MTAKTTAAERFQSPDTYTPKYLAEKIRALAVLENERKQVTVLFADIKGSTELIADQDPEEASKILDAVLQQMIESVHRFEGTVSRVIGDGIMALFGAPLALEDHAVRGCYAALLIQEKIKRYSEQTRHTAGLSIQVRIGLNSGEVIMRSILSDLHMDYTAVGQTTHLAARMEQIAAPGSILVTRNVVNLSKGYIDVNPLGPMPVKGLRRRVEVFEVIGSGTVRSRLQAAVARGLTPFVGRLAEMEALRSASEQAAAGHGQIVGVTGEAGIGKSRLFYEFIHSSDVQGWLVLESNSFSHTRSAPYAQLTEFVKNYFQIDSQDDKRTIWEKVTRKLLVFEEALQDAIPPVLYLLETLPEDHSFQELEPVQRREHIASAIRRIVLSESRLRPVLAVFEDLHGADSPSLRVLDEIMGGLRDTRVLLLVDYRGEHQDEWSSLPNYHRIWLDPLPTKGMEELLHAMLGPDRSLDALKVLLIERTEGNPLFIEEIVRTLVETNALSGERGRYVLAKPVSSIEVPPLVQDVIASRIDRLPSAQKRLIQEASVIGRRAFQAPPDDRRPV
jgi:class 3 adenylate cyclase